MQTPRRTVPIFLVVLVIAIAVVNGLADKYYWYWQMRWFDIPMHFAGGVWLAGIAFWWFFSPATSKEVRFLKILTVCLLAAFGIGFIWEIYEAMVSYITVGHINAMSDTIKDLSFDIIGGTAVAIWGWHKLNK